MNIFKLTLFNEIDKLLKRKKLLLALILSILGVVFGQVVVMVFQKGLSIGIVSMSGFPVMVLSFFSQSLLILFVILIVIDLFTVEFNNNTIKLSLSKPVTRFKLYLAKVLSIGIFILFNLIILLIMSLITGMIFNFGLFSIRVVFNSILVYMVTLLPLLAISMIIVLLANIIKSSTMVFFMSIFVLLVLKVIEILFPGYSSFLVTSMIGWYNLWISDSIMIVQILKEFLIMASFSIMIFIIGFIKFEKRDF